MLIAIIQVFAFHWIMPAYIVYALWCGREKSRIIWLLKALYTCLFILFIFLAGRWDWIGYYLRFVWLALLAAALVVSWRRSRGELFLVQDGRRNWMSLAGNMIIVLLFLGFLALSVRGYFYADEPVGLAFPLRGGRSYIAQGGNSSQLNYHNKSRSQRYALDITALNMGGVRALGLYPSDLGRYVIYEAPVYSPCAGDVLEATDGLSDQAPPQTNHEQMAGNHIVIACGGIRVWLAHLRNGSVTVHTGERVMTGQQLGKVGNTGNSSEPHLHIHALRTGGAGVPILFDGRFAARNALLVK